jgi:hypothetical protein
MNGREDYTVTAELNNDGVGLKGSDMISLEIHNSQR